PYWYQAETETMAQRHGLPVDLVTAVVWAESSGLTHAYRYEPAFWRRYLEDKPEWDGANPARVSASYGLMQVMFPVAVEFGYSRSRLKARRGLTSKPMTLLVVEPAFPVDGLHRQMGVAGCQNPVWRRAVGAK
ncbi:MAG: hypothetical protein ACK5FF_03605, partial [Planctomyces sp.]